MNKIKHRRLKAKRTSWAKTRSGRRANSRTNVMRAMVIARRAAQAGAVKAAASIDRMGKSAAIAASLVSTFSASSRADL